MTISQAFDRLSRLETALRSGLADTIRVAGGDMCASIADRVINEGKADNNQPFTPYSTKPVPAYFYLGRSRSGAGEAKVKAAAKERKGVSYRDFRAMNNLPTTPKNFSFTNDMWRHFGVKSVRPSAAGYTLEIGGTSPDAVRKMEYHRQRERRDITSPSTAELSRLTNRITLHLQNILTGG